MTLPPGIMALLDHDLRQRRTGGAGATPAAACWDQLSSSLSMSARNTSSHRRLSRWYVSLSSHVNPVRVWATPERGRRRGRGEEIAGSERSKALQINQAKSRQEARRGARRSKRPGARQTRGKTRGRWQRARRCSGGSTQHTNRGEVSDSAALGPSGCSIMR
jgi:hypothetical protein